MKNFMDENFLLQTETAQKLYHEHAAKMPIIDYHCHLIPQMVADDYQFKSLTEIWLGGDHYKWRAMRTNGVDERYCTGKDTTDWEKFEKWAETVPYTIAPVMDAWGFTTEERHVPAPDALAAAMALVDSEELSVDTEASAASLARAGMEVVLFYFFISQIIWVAA